MIVLVDGDEPEFAHSVHVEVSGLQPGMVSAVAIDRLRFDPLIDGPIVLVWTLADSKASMSDSR